MKIIWLLLTSVPSLVEGFLDRRGESKKGKVKDTIWLVIVAAILVGGAWWLGQRPLAIAGLILGWRILVFDYLVTWLLIKNDVIVGQWWNYTGKTSKWDKLISKVNPLVRFAIRVALFALAVWWFLSQ